MDEFSGLTSSLNLRHEALSMFECALRRVEAGRAVHSSIELYGSNLRICETHLNFAGVSDSIYAIALGKAAYPMALALDEALHHKVKAGVVVGPEVGDSTTSSKEARKIWQIYQGGHPLPNEQSLLAARAAFQLLELANNERGLVIFLISGGGSAMMEWPANDRINLQDLRITNDALISCGASIGEINTVRRRISAVKGGGLAERAPNANQLSLIVSDTEPGEPHHVASGPAFEGPSPALDAGAVVGRYGLATRLPSSILQTIAQPQRPHIAVDPKLLRDHYVLADNRVALEAATQAALERGFFVETHVYPDHGDQRIEHGCSLLFARLLELRKKATDTSRPVCIVSGGEFACRVSGDGIGGRNSETVLRLAIKLAEHNGSIPKAMPSLRATVMSAGTDGIDGNSPAAGAMADETTIDRAIARIMDAHTYLSLSNSYSFFNALDDAIVTGPTGTNVRDIRILMAH